MSGSRWLAVVGVGEDGLDGLSPAAQRLVSQAAFVVGGRRHLALAGPLAAKSMSWPSPIENALEAIEAWRGKPVAALASGDPFFFGIGTMLLKRFSPDDMICVPAPSAFALAAARLGWSEQDCAMLSLHGRPLEAIVPHLQPNARILALSWDGATPRKLAALLTLLGMGASKLTVCEAMGGPNERLREAEAATFPLDQVAALNTIALEVIAGFGARVLPRAPGLPDDWFEHDGQITKRDIRAITLSALGPRRGELLWDVGAGSGSVGVEWMLADPANRTVAIEANAERAERIARNKQSLGVPALSVVHCRAPGAYRGLARPDAVFIGGGPSETGVVDGAADSLKPGGRLVVNAVTLEAQAALIAERGRRGGELVQITIARAEPVGRFAGWRPAMPVVQWRWTKP